MKEIEGNARVDRVIIFTQSSDRIAHVLLRAYFEVFLRQREMELVAVCLPQQHRNGRLVYRFIRDFSSRLLRSIFDRKEKERPRVPTPVFIDRWAKKLGFSIIVPPNANINDPDFLAMLRTEFKPTVAISCVCLKKFGPELLAIFEYAINYHNALLPNYKGIKATAWSMYFNEETTGYTFHLMNEHLDEGAIIIQGTLPIKPDDRIVDLDLLKAQQAAILVPKTLEMALKREPGTPQVGHGSYYSKNDKLRIQEIADPSEISSEELARRLWAFGELQMKIDGSWYSITKLAGPFDESVSRKNLIFQTSDKLSFRPTRIDYLPLALFQIRKCIKKILK